MGKSRRRPYAAVTGVRSAAHDKMVARRCWRRAQEHALRTHSGDWDDFLIPERYETTFNDVWSWGRDGKQTLRRLDHNDLNPYYCTRYFTGSLQDLMRRHEEGLAHTMSWIAELKRK